MSLKAERNRKKLAKKARKGFTDYPAATVAFYGPTDKQATKVTVSIIPSKDSPPERLTSWYSEHDVRRDEEIGQMLLDYMAEHGIKSVVMTDRIIGCPHQEGIDYPEGETCPVCTFWKGRDRWTGERIN
ncbi:hypothetical protein [Methylotuvimicrobium buryatense]|uniref:hypothetical protein n=1 Tax=Methylotuvimicrobium buryatense TaxID=95641 RepID=UPI00034BF746|nr:hypothetical protein [Methylotuvimicrobium buryatense]